MKFGKRKEEKALSIVMKLNDAGYRAYFAGGCVRDRIMGRIPVDYDIATDAQPDDVKRLFASTIPVGACFGVTMVLVDDDRFEIAVFRKDESYSNGRRPDAISFSTPKEDALRRDFTINGMFYDPFEEKIIDFVGGCKDIDKRLIRTIGDPVKRFEEDALRLLRGVRFAASFNFELEKKTFEAIKTMAQSLNRISQERIGDELHKILMEKHADRALYLLKETGLLKIVLPEVDVLSEVEQSLEYHPEGNAFEHTAKILGLLENPTPSLAWAVLLHDVGKKDAKEASASGAGFIDHAKVGAEKAVKILNRLRLSIALIKRVEPLVRHHMRFRDVRKMKKSTLKRFLGLANFREHLELERLDSLASNGDLSNYTFASERFEDLSEEELHPKALLTGDSLIAWGYKPGPLFNDILSLVMEKQLSGKLSTSEEAKAFVLKKFKRP